MTPPPDISEAAASLVRRLSKTLLSLVATPAAVVTEAGRVVATKLGRRLSDSNRPLRAHWS
jgi:hypothetical protein